MSDFKPYKIHCPTCDAGLVVRNPKLVGQILACPKCESMVLIEPPVAEIQPTAPVSPNPSKPVPRPAASTQPPVQVTSEKIATEINPAENLENNPVTAGPEQVHATTRLSDRFKHEERTRRLLLVGLGSFAGLLLLVFLLLQIFGGGDADNQQAANGGEQQSQQTDPPNTNGHPGEELVGEERVGDDGKVFENDFGDGDTGGNSIFGDIFPDENLGVNGEDPLDPGEIDEIGSGTDPGDTVELPDFLPPPEFVDDNHALATEDKIPEPRIIVSLSEEELEARLRLGIMEIKFEKTPFIDVIETLSNLSNIPITIDAAALRFRGYSCEFPVDIHLQDTTVNEILDKTLEIARLLKVVRHGQILLTLPPADNLEFSETEIDITDFARIEGGQSRLLDLIERMVVPETWKSQGGTAEISLEGNRLRIVHTKLVADEVLRFIEQWRVLQGLPQKTGRVEGKLAPEVFGWDSVNEPITMNFYAPTPLSQCFRNIRSRTNLRILTNHLALIEQDERIESTVSTVLASKEKGNTIDDALNGLLAEVDLCYRIIDEKTIEVTTPSEAAKSANMHFEAHLIRAQEGKVDQAGADDVIRSIKGAIAPDSWRIPGNAGSLGLGDIAYDLNSGCLIVRQSQPVQRMIRKWLASRTIAPALESGPEEKEDDEIEAAE